MSQAIEVTCPDLWHQWQNPGEDYFLEYSNWDSINTPLAPSQYSGPVKLPDDVQLTKPFLTSSPAGNLKGNISQVFLNRLHSSY